MDEGIRQSLLLMQHDSLERYCDRVEITFDQFRELFRCPNEPIENVFPEPDGYQEYKKRRVAEREAAQRKKEARMEKRKLKTQREKQRRVTLNEFGGT